MTHLHPKSRPLNLAGVSLTLNIDYGWHVFTDEKGVGDPFSYRRQQRYFCVERYQNSFQVASFFEQRLELGHCLPYKTKSLDEQYYCAEDYDIAMFFAVQKCPLAHDTLNLHVVSAYTVQQWGKSGLPKGQWKKTSFVLRTRNSGRTVLP